MKRGGLSICAALFVAAVASPVHAQPGNGALSGPHFNLNIIGVDKGKKPDMAGSDRHTIFVALGTAGAVEPKKSFIYLVPSAEFAVCDGNAFDAAIDCNGTPIKPLGAVFSLPCNTNISLAGADLLQACDPTDNIPDASYAVFARGLGKPGKNGDAYAVMTTCATALDTGEIECSTENTLDVGALVRKSGKTVFQDVTKELTSLVACTTDASTGVETCTRYALFDDDFIDFFWQYDNFGLKLAQLRFYPLS